MTKTKTYPNNRPTQKDTSNAGSCKTSALRQEELNVEIEEKALVEALQQEEMNVEMKENGSRGI
ncbi:hypothetical protein Bpfe_003762, partial [Biomphalaria pfeifferi]